MKNDRTPLAETSQTTMIARCQRGDRDAQRQLYESCRPKTYRLMVRMVGIEQGELGSRTGAFRTDEFCYLAEAVNSMSASLAEAERRRRAEMAYARHIQEQLLPGEVAVGGLQFAHLYRPADDVAGDYYDILPLHDGGWLDCIADVTGHGVAAALSATMLRAFLQEATEHHADPSRILRFVNHRLAVACRTENFASMVVVRWDLSSRRLQYASAGHESGWRPSGRRDGSCPWAKQSIASPSHWTNRRQTGRQAMMSPCRRWKSAGDGTRGAGRDVAQEKARSKPEPSQKGGCLRWSPGSANPKRSARRAGSCLQRLPVGQPAGNGDVAGL